MSEDLKVRRFAVTLDEKVFEELNSYIGTMRIKVPLFAAIAKQLVRVMKPMSPMERRVFAASIVAGDITISDWMSIKEVDDAVKRTEVQLK